MRGSPTRTVLAGIAGGVAFSASMIVTFRLIGFGWDGDGILLRSTIQSPKLIAVWTRIEPLPMVMSNPAPIFAVLILFSVGHAFVYRWLSRSWPPGVLARTGRYGGLTFFLTYSFWELFTPINQFGEPLPLVALELLFWAVIAFSEAFAIAVVLESPRGRDHAERFKVLADAVQSHIHGALDWLPMVEAMSAAHPGKPSGHSRWRFSLSLSAAEIKRLDTLPLVMNWLDQLQINPQHRGQAFLVLGELFNNALDHGLLGLDSQLKQDPDGFEQYIEQREARLSQLTDATIEVDVEHFF